MITVIVLLLVLIVVIAIVLPTSMAGTLSHGEKTYLFSTPLPLILALLLPSAVALLAESDPTARTWNEWLTDIGIWLSGALGLAGIVLIWRNRMRTGALDRRLVGGIFLASIPALMLLLVILLRLS